MRAPASQAHERGGVAAGAPRAGGRRHGRVHRRGPAAGL